MNYKYICDSYSTLCMYTYKRACHIAPLGLLRMMFKPEMDVDK